MWGTSRPDDKLTADLCSVIEAAESGDRQLIRIMAGKLLPDNFDFCNNICQKRL
jgi:hypothetical protein